MGVFIQNRSMHAVAFCYGRKLHHLNGQLQMRLYRRTQLPITIMFLYPKNASVYQTSVACNSQLGLYSQNLLRSSYINCDQIVKFLPIWLFLKSHYNILERSSRPKMPFLANQICYIFTLITSFKTCFCRYFQFSKVV